MNRERTTGTKESSADTTVHPSKGMAGLAIAWKVAALMPLVLTGAVLAGRIDFGGDDPGTSPSANISVIDDRTPEALDTEVPEDDADKNKGDKGDKKSEEPSPSDSPSADPTTASPTSDPTTDDPTPHNPDPTKSPTKSPTKNPSPSPTDTPTPDEAREACEEAGVNPLNVAAMAACIAEALGGG